MSWAALLVLAMLLDAAMGEPERLWSHLPHPAVLMGHAVGWCDDRLNAGAGRRVTGALTIAALAGLAWIIGALIAEIGWLLEVIVAAILLAQRSLADHVSDVAESLTASLEKGREAVARIVGRDTSAMEDDDVARAAIESAAENLSDGVIAPAFWFLIGGLPAMLVYKMVNTADSMIGYRTARHEEFGKAAARLDDLLNWVPARITAGLLLVTGGAWARRSRVGRDAPLHRSPNAGWPEAAMAVTLDVALSGPRSYHGERRDFPFVNPEGRYEIGAGDIDDAVGMLWRAWLGGLALAAVIAVVW